MNVCRSWRLKCQGWKLRTDCPPATRFSNANGVRLSADTKVAFYERSPLVVIAVRAIELAGQHAAFLETTSLTRTGMGRCVPVSRINSLSPCTMRVPRFTLCSDG
jgi:hypothetical protein